MISEKINENTLSIRCCRSESRLNIWVFVYGGKGTNKVENTKRFYLLIYLIFIYFIYFKTLG